MARSQPRLAVKAYLVADMVQRGKLPGRGLGRVCSFQEVNDRV